MRKHSATLLYSLSRVYVMLQNRTRFILNQPYAQRDLRKLERGLIRNFHRLAAAGVG